MARVFMIRGKAGVGKTAISNAVSKLMSIGVVRKDDVYDALADYISDHQMRNEVCEAVMKNAITTNINNECDVIVDYSCHHIDHYHEFRDWAKSVTGEFRSILMICSDEDVWKERFNRRKLNPRPNNIITDFDALKKHYGDLKTESSKGELILDSIHDLEENAQEAAMWMSNEGSM